MAEFAVPADELAEEAEFRTALAEGTVAAANFSDELFARCRDAVAQAASGGATSLDVAVLIRQVLRRGSERDQIPFRLVLKPGPGLEVPTKTWQMAGVTALTERDGRILLDAEPFLPSWLNASIPVDAAAVAGTSAGLRANYDDVKADPFFTDATGYPTYKTPGQRSAVRAAVTMPPGSTLIAELPTGTGKTEIAITVSYLSRGQTVIIVVPTVALAYDFERRFQELHAGRAGRAGAALTFAWTGDTDTGHREFISQNLRRGQIPLLVTSPESLGGAIRDSLISAAGAGRVAALVVDEAHLVTQWGYDFRPEFRELATLRQEVLTAAASGGHGLPRTMLLSATMGAAELADLTTLFGEPGPVSLVAANMLRREPDYWVAPWCTAQERRERLLEALSRLPRPLILYVTRPEDADTWHELIRSRGFGRAAIVTGKTAGETRRDVLAGLRTGAGEPSRYDVVIATSAFGLGIDYPGIRSVVHACLPETVDRWYQEVGRGGRDGHASVALLLPASDDDDVAASLGIRTLTAEVAQERWQALWGAARQRIAANSFVDVHSAPPGRSRGSYNHRWNAQLLRGLEDLAQIRRRVVSRWEAEQIGLEWTTDNDWEQVELLTEEMHDPGFFERVWMPWRDKAVEPFSTAFEAMKSITSEGTSVCDVISQAYAPDDWTWRRFGVAAGTLLPESGCGRCPHCRERGILPEHGPSPSPGGTWQTDATPGTTLSALLAACPSARNVAVLVDDAPTDRVSTLAPLLWAAGVRYFAGVRDWQPARKKDWAFIDDSIDHPSQAPPLAGFVLPRPDALASGHWLEPMARAQDARSQPVPLILLIRTGARIGTNDNFRRLRASAAEHMLRARST